MDWPVLLASHYTAKFQKMARQRLRERGRVLAVIFPLILPLPEQSFQLDDDTPRAVVRQCKWSHSVISPFTRFT